MLSSFSIQNRIVSGSVFGYNKKSSANLSTCKYPNIFNMCYNVCDLVYGIWNEFTDVYDDDFTS